MAFISSISSAMPIHLAHLAGIEVVENVSPSLSAGAALPAARKRQSNYLPASLSDAEVWERAGLGRYPGSAVGAANEPSALQPQHGRTRSCLQPWQQALRAYAKARALPDPFPGSDAPHKATGPLQPWEQALRCVAKARGEPDPFPARPSLDLM